MNYKVSVIGLGFVGLTLASFLSERGVKVIGVDIDENKIDYTALGIGK